MHVGTTARAHDPSTIIADTLTTGMGAYGYIFGPQSMDITYLEYTLSKIQYFKSVVL